MCKLGICNKSKIGTDIFFFFIYFLDSDCISVYKKMLLVVKECFLLAFTDVQPNKIKCLQWNQPRDANSLKKVKNNKSR